jgi:hypothetical protein
VSSDPLNRRDFHQLSLAALGGLAAGLVAGCGKSDPPQSTAAAAGEAVDPEQLLLADPHVCRGLNTCKGKGSDGENDCAGRGACASPVARHECAGQNDCKGQGGCGSLPGQNACKGQGGCAVPLEGGMWDKARRAYEAAMKKAGKEFGPAPAKS